METGSAGTLADEERDRADAQPVVLGAGGRSAALAGAGIVNLVTALELTRSGYAVTVYDQAPDPRGDAHWTAYGCTRGGGDGRMFTLTEADSYNSRAWPGKDLLTRPISDRGWLVAKPGDLTGAELRWADAFHQIPPWLAESYNEDIFDVNRAAGTLWDKLRTTDPGLFTDTTGYRDGILRLYTEDDYYQWHLARNNRVGATRRALTAQQVRSGYPALADAESIAGGIEVVGFTVNIHKFVAKLVNLLEAGGVQFHWQTTVTSIEWDGGTATGLKTDQETIRADHYVVSPGAYGDELLNGTESHERIQGMLGVWLTVPNVEPRLDHSVKIARKGHRAEETNVTLATDENGDPVLVCGSGYGWTGLNPGNIDSAELDVLFDALEDTIRHFFPQAHQAAKDNGTLDASRRMCVRPWTSSCLGVFETKPARNGVLVVTGGHNTGGFTQSPVVAEAVLAAVQGREHLMHKRFHPLRLDRFYSTAGTGATSFRITS
ncbi:FAD-dependent oxidoreductase [Actinocrispum sp. NPDC049592]|uniref:NAD(P)/FAD-dependent oxidoreductase n=1 Tax=Actinocrispum sp. NPDC049592 TaxID=3154835 RepID=UPI00343B1608